ncbi:hypothetical protein MHU86_19622 [Fragilaria crotonensis]|nr:hypothetical protein MHU86_19622 [Fragilaria crotonensis]
MDFDASTDGKLPAIEWQVVGAKNRPRQNTDATQTPLPASQNDRNHPPDENHYTDKLNSAWKLPVVTQQTTTEPDNSFVQINDGTIRITVKWKPAKYEELTDDITNGTTKQLT